MSRRLIALNPDLMQLQNEGFDIEERGGYLLVKDIPYVTSSREVRRGTLISKLELAGDLTKQPSDHVAYWTGEHPCHSDGRKLAAFENPSPPQDFGNEIRADFTFSAKAAYRDYHHKMTTYIGRIVAEANQIDASVKAQTFPAIAAEDDVSVFKYIDTASSRSGIGALNGKLVGQRVGIIGLGGTGAYVLDLVAKTSVAEIHLFDDDVFSQHNAFRAPGAPTLEQLREHPKKVAHFSAIYSNMRNGIFPHDSFIDETNIALLDGLGFVFLCMDRASAKRIVVRRLAENGTPFIEVGMGVLKTDDGLLSGLVRVATSTRDTREEAARHISFADGDAVANEYSTNIQIAELNALNAAMAVIRWKKLAGIYRDSRNEYHAGYSLAAGEIVTEGTL